MAIATPGFNGERGTVRAQGWWTLTPGEKAYLADTHFSDFYYYAISTDGREWKGTPPCQTAMGQTGKPCFKYIDTGMRNFGDYTLNLTCN